MQILLELLDKSKANDFAELAEYYFIGLLVFIQYYIVISIKIFIIILHCHVIRQHHKFRMSKILKMVIKIHEIIDQMKSKFFFIFCFSSEIIKLSIIIKFNK